MSAANWKQHMTTTPSAEVRRPANGRFSGNDAVDILEKLPSRAICAESCNMKLPIRSRTKANLQSSNQCCTDDQMVEDDGSKQIELCLETQCAEDAEDGYIPLAGNTNFSSVLIKDSAGDLPEKILEPEASHCTLEQKKPEASHSGVSSDRAKIEKQLSPIPEDYSMRKKKVKRVSIGSWASVSFSHTDDTETLRFVAAVRNKCVVDLGLDFDLLPIVFTSLKSALPDGIEKALRDLFETIEEFGINRKQLGLFIVILPDTSGYEEKVEDVCKDLGVAYHCLSPDAIKLGQHLSAAYEIYCKLVSNGKQDGNSTEMDEMGKDYITNCDEEMSSDGDSSEIYGFTNEMDGFEPRWGEDDNCDEETSESEIFEFELLDGCQKHMREDDVSKADNSAKNCFKTNKGMEKPSLGSSSKRSYADLVKIKVKRSIEMYWACVRFSYVDGMQLLTFLCNLQTKLMAFGMDFSTAPIKIDQVGSVPADIRTHLFSVRDSVSELFTKLGMKGEQISLLLVILPEDTSCHAEVDDVCKSLGVVYQCLPDDARMLSEQYVKKTAHQIKFKVVQAVPLLSKVPTIFIGADLSPGEGSEHIASMAASVDWPKASKYTTQVSRQPSHKVFILVLKKQMMSFFRAFYLATGKFPESMIFFRHGIVDAQIISKELRAIGSIRRAGLFPIRFTYVVVRKKHDMEFELRYKKTKKRTGVKRDTSLTNITEFEVLYNHSSVMGTSMPVHYHGVYDENNLTPNDLQSIIITLSELHEYNVVPEISMIPPAHYAWRAARQA